MPSKKSSQKKNLFLAIFCCILLLLGLLSTLLFSIEIGGVLIGLCVGLYFYNNLAAFFHHFRQNLSKESLTKTLVRIVLFLYLLLVLPLFIIAIAIGYGLMSLKNWLSKRRSA